MGRLTIWYLTGLILLAITSNIDVYASSDGPTESECRPYIEKALNELKTGEVPEVEQRIDDGHADETGKEVEKKEFEEEEEQMLGDEPITEETSEDVEQSTLPLESDIESVLKVDENDLDGDGIPNDEDDDIDGDGIPNIDDNDIDGDGVPNHEDSDIDGDGVPNDEDDDIDGDGIPNSEDDDIDGDGVPNHEDNDIDGDGIPNVEDNDIDGDGIPNNEDDDIDGDGVPNQEDDDIDGDGILNVDDSDMDGDGISNEHDEDMDGDGVVNEHDDDMDGDGIANEHDNDIDGDGLPNHEDDDLDGDGIPNHEDDDIDGDGIPNHEDGDIDGDGIPNSQDIDLDGDGIPNPHDHDIDGDGVPNPEDTDIDGDGIENVLDQDIDGDGIPNTEDQDIDGDGLPNEQEPVSLDIDGDGVPNDDDSDIDGDVIPNELDEDMDGDGIPNTDDLDIDGDGIPNAHDEDKLEPLPIQPGAQLPPEKDHVDQEEQQESQVVEPEEAEEEMQNDEEVQDKESPHTEEDHIEVLEVVEEGNVAESQQVEEEDVVEEEERTTGEVSVDEQIKEEDEVIQRSKRSLESTPSDMDGDGIPDHEDEDVDGDGVPNHLDDDIDGDGVPNEKDEDRDGDGIPNEQDDNDGEADDKKEVEEVEEDNKKEEAAIVSEEEDIKPEDELLWEGEMPEVRRNRDHIVELLQLGEDSYAREDALDGVAKIILRDIKRIYESAIKPLETMYKYRDLSNRHFSDPEVFSKPLVLFMGPWSGGKSTIINYLTDNEYSSYSLRTGAEPSPAYFNILMWGNKTEILDGTQLAADYTFSGLQKFGQGLEDRLRGLKMPNKLLEKVNIVEIPGILEVRKQVSRLFPFNDACQWFIDRADIIFLVYDPAKLDVGPETEAILDQLKGREYQSRIILNKADTVKPEELLRVQSALIWNISPLMSSAQPPLIYTTSLWSLPYVEGSPARLLLAQERAFLRDLRTAIEKRIENKIASARRFAVRVRNHAKMVDCYLNTYYNHKTLFSNKKRIADNIIENPQNYHIYEGLSTLTNISRYDLPDPEVYRDFFRLNPLYEFKKLSETCSYFRGCPLQKLDVAIAYDLPDLTGKYKKMAEAALLKAELSSQPKS